MKAIKKLQAKGLYDRDKEDPFDMFISSTSVRWCYYKETQRILGATYGHLGINTSVGTTHPIQAIVPKTLNPNAQAIEARPAPKS